jgi:quercetin dioxygenase-like cupin family protein
MKRTILVFLLLAAMAVTAAAQNSVVTSADMKWMAFPNFPDCTKGTVLHGDPSAASGVVVEAKATAGCKIPWHWHTPNEQVGVISGTAKLEMKDGGAKTMTAGSYAFLQSKHVHQFTCTTACSIFVAADNVFDIHYVDASGKEIPADQAVGKKGAAPAKKAPPKK